MVALVHLCYYCDRLVAVTLDLPTTTCYSDTSITTARRGPVAPDALRLAHITTVVTAINILACLIYALASQPEARGGRQITCCGSVICFVLVLLPPPLGELGF